MTEDDQETEVADVLFDYTDEAAQLAKHAEPPTIEDVVKVLQDGLARFESEDEEELAAVEAVSTFEQAIHMLREVPR